MKWPFVDKKEVCLFASFILHYVERLTQCLQWVVGSVAMSILAELDRQGFNSITSNVSRISFSGLSDQVSNSQDLIDKGSNPLRLTIDAIPAGDCRISGSVQLAELGREPWSSGYGM